MIVYNDDIVTIRNFALSKRVTPAYLYKMEKEGKFNVIIIDGVKFANKNEPWGGRPKVGRKKLVKLANEVKRRNPVKETPSYPHFELKQQPLKLKMISPDQIKKDQVMPYQFINKFPDIK